jgi:hypothetical protein
MRRTIEDMEEEDYRVNDILDNLHDYNPEYSNEDLLYFLVKLVKRLKKEKAIMNDLRDHREWVEWLDDVGKGKQ